MHQNFSHQSQQELVSKSSVSSQQKKEAFLMGNLQPQVRFMYFYYVWCIQLFILGCGRDLLEGLKITKLRLYLAEF